MRPSHNTASFPNNRVQYSLATSIPLTTGKSSALALKSIVPSTTTGTSIGILTATTTATPRVTGAPKSSTEQVSHKKLPPNPPLIPHNKALLKCNNLTSIQILITTEANYDS